MKNVFIYVNACTRRLLDAHQISNYLQKNNYKLVNKPDRADIILFIACGFLDSISSLALSDVKRFQRYDAELIVAGCLPETDKEKLGEIFNGKTISTKELTNNPEKIDRLFPGDNIKFRKVMDVNTLFSPCLDESKASGVVKKVLKRVNFIQEAYTGLEEHILKNLYGEYIFGERSQKLWWYSSKNPFYFIRISWGCPDNCSFCGIKKAIGQFKSKSLNQCSNELKKGLSMGYKNFILNADESGAYGIDIGSNFVELLDELTAIKGDFQIIVRHINPRWIVKYAADLEPILERNKVKNLDIPVQTGNNRILKLMNRYPEIDEIENTFLNLRRKFPKVTIYAHFIIGFPTEKWTEFEQTLSFIKKTKPDAGTLFPFSLKSGTKAEKIKPKITEKEMIRRMKYAKKIVGDQGYQIVGCQPFTTNVKSPMFFEIEQKLQK